MPPHHLAHQRLPDRPPSSRALFLLASIPRTKHSQHPAATCAHSPLLSSLPRQQAAPVQAKRRVPRAKSRPPPVGPPLHSPCPLPPRAASPAAVTWPSPPSCPCAMASSPFIYPSNLLHPLRSSLILDRSPPPSHPARARANHHHHHSRSSRRQISTRSLPSATSLLVLSIVWCRAKLSSSRDRDASERAERAWRGRPSRASGRAGAVVQDGLLLDVRLHAAESPGTYARSYMHGRSACARTV